MSKSSNIDKQEAKVMADLAEAHAIKSNLIAELAAAKPAEQDAKHEAIASADKEIADHEAKLRNLGQARKLIEERDSAEYKAAEWAQAKAQRALVDTLGEQMYGHYRALIEKIEELHPIVAAIEACGNDRASAAYAVLRACYGVENIDRVYTSQLATVLRGDIPGVRGIVADALFATSFARAGLHLDPFVEIQGARMEVGLDEVLNKVEHMIGRTLDQAMERHPLATEQPAEVQA